MENRVLNIFLFIKILLINIGFISVVIAEPSSQIHEINKISEINKYVDSKTMVLFDIDNTILTAEQSLGSDQWFDYYVNKNLSEGKDKNTAVNVALNEWRHIHKYTKVKPLERDTKEVIHSVQAKTPYVYVLSARSGATYKMSRDELTSIGISFNNNMNSKIPSLQLYETVDSIYKNGLILAGITPNSGKGGALKEFIKKSGINIKNFNKIIFIDDKKHNVDDVATASADLGLSFIGLRYSAADVDVKNFTGDIANKQLSFLQRCGKLISDTFANVLNLQDGCNVLKS
jgi:hypothetical protein